MISCTQNVDVEEGLKVEFKSSLLFAPNNAPTYVQQEAIARTICAFINSEGGTLYLGVNDVGYPVGLSYDLRELSANPRRFTTKGAFATDEGYSYRPTIDQLYLKFQKIIEAHLGKRGLQYILDYDKKEDGSNVYLVIPVKPADKGDFIYFINHQGKAEIWIRTPGATRILTDKDRDDFIAAKEKERCSKETDKLLKSIHAQLSAMLTLGKTNQDDDKSNVPQNESLDSALKSLMAEVSSVLFPQKSILQDCVEYYATFDNQTSAMAIMDEFEKTYNGRKVYGRMVLSRDPALCSVPYSWNESDSCFHKITECDFGLSWVSLLIERCNCPTGNSLIDISYRESFTFSDLKSKSVNRLHEFIWAAIPDDLKTGPTGGWHTILFKRFMGFKAHNSWSNAHCASIPLYRIVGVRCSKHKLFGSNEKADLSPYAKSASYGCDVVSPYCIMESYNQLCNKYIPYEQINKLPTEYSEAKHLEDMKAAKLLGRDASLDILNASFCTLIVNVHTIGELADLTDSDIRSSIDSISNPQTLSVLHSLGEAGKQKLFTVITDARQNAKDFLRQNNIAVN